MLTVIFNSSLVSINAQTKTENCQSWNSFTMADSWRDSSWESDAVLESMVFSFLQHCPFEKCLPQDCAKPQRADLDVQRCVTSFTNKVIKIRIRGQPDLGFIVKMAPLSLNDAAIAEPLPEDRGQTEYKAYRVFNTLVPHSSASPLFYNRKDRLLCTRELTNYLPLSGAVLGGVFSENAARSLGTTLASIHGATFITVVGDAELNRIGQQFPARDAMLALIRDYHFERPFHPAGTGRRCHPSVLRMLPEIHNDPAVASAKVEVERSFLNDLECLIHGDLHIESILVQAGQVKIVDAEFTRLGPCAYDMGLLIATLLVAFHRYNRHRQQAESTNHLLGDINHHDGRSSTGGSGQDDLNIHTEQSRQEKHVQCSISVLDSSASKPSAEGAGRVESVTEGRQFCTHKHCLFRATSSQPAPQIPVNDTSCPSDTLTSALYDFDAVQRDVDHIVQTTQFAVSGDGKATSPAAAEILSKCSLLLQEYTDTLVRCVQPEPTARHAFLQSLLHNIATFAGCELLAWVIGPPHMDFMDSSPPAQVDCVKTALHLLRNRHRVSSVADLVNVLSIGF